MKLLFLNMLALFSTLSAREVYTRSQILQEFRVIEVAYRAIERLPEDVTANDYANALLHVLEQRQAQLSTHDKKRICYAILNLRCLHGDTCSSVSHRQKKEARAVLHRIEEEGYRTRGKKLKEFACRAEREYEKFKARRQDAR